MRRLPEGSEAGGGGLMDCCPKCGGTGGYIHNVRAGGWWTAYKLWSGVIVDTNLDKIKRRPDPKTVTCVDCGARLPNPGKKGAPDDIT